MASISNDPLERRGDRLKCPEPMKESNVFVAIRVTVAHTLPGTGEDVYSPNLITEWKCVYSWY